MAPERVGDGEVGVALEGVLEPGGDGLEDAEGEKPGLLFDEPVSEPGDGLVVRDGAVSIALGMGSTGVCVPPAVPSEAGLLLALLSSLEVPPLGVPANPEAVPGVPEAVPGVPEAVPGVSELVPGAPGVAGVVALPGDALLDGIAPGGCPWDAAYSAAATEAATAAASPDPAPPSNHQHYCTTQ